MKLLVVGHSYLTAFAQNKYVAMKALHPDLKLRLVVPPQIPHPFKVYTAERHPALQPEEVVVIPVLCGRDHMRYLPDPLRLIRLLASFEPDHIHIEEDPHSFVGFTLALIAPIAAPRAKLSYFIWDNLARKPKFPLNIIKAMMTRIALTRAALVVCGNTEAEHLLRTVKGFCGATAVLPQLGIDAHDYVRPIDSLVQQRFGSGGPWIGYLGRLVEEKGLRYLLEAMIQMMDRHWRLLVVGSGPFEAEIKSIWQPRLGDRLVLLSAVAHDKVADHLRCLDVFVLPSYAVDGWKEQFGLTLAQAMMAGVACVGSDSGAIPEVIGGGGLVVPEHDSIAIEKALRAFLSSEKILRAHKNAARRQAVARFTTEMVSENHFVLFESISRPNVFNAL